IDEVRPDLVHVHHLAAHGLGLLRVIARRHIPYVYQLQDWWAVCARSNLLPPSRALCSGPGPAKCSRCLPLTGLGPAPLLNRLLYRYRACATKRALAGADAIVAGSVFAVSTHRELGYLRPDARVHVIPYGVAIDSRRPAPDRRTPSSPLRFGLIGSMMPHKGIHVAVEAFRDVDPDRATLDVWGDASILPGYTRELRDGAWAAVRLHEPFAEECRGEVFASMDVLLVPSLGLESFGLVVREALSHGVPVIASRRGALLEAFEDGYGGEFVPPGDARALRDCIEGLCYRPPTIVAWRRPIPAVQRVREQRDGVQETRRDGT